MPSNSRESPQLWCYCCLPSPVKTEVLCMTATFLLPCKHIPWVLLLPFISRGKTILVYHYCFPTSVKQHGKCVTFVYQLSIKNLLSNLMLPASVKTKGLCVTVAFQIQVKQKTYLLLCFPASVKAEGLDVTTINHLLWKHKYCVLLPPYISGKNTMLVCYWCVPSSVKIYACVLLLNSWSIEQTAHTSLLSSSSRK